MALLEIGLNLKLFLTVTILIQNEVKGINQTRTYQTGINQTRINQTGINQNGINQTGINQTLIDQTGFNDTGK